MYYIITKTYPWCMEDMILLYDANKDVFKLLYTTHVIQIKDPCMQWLGRVALNDAKR